MPAIHEQSPVTLLLSRWRTGDREALDELAPQIYGELRGLACALFRHERKSHTLQPTALVGEAFLRLCGGQPPDFESRGHFLAIAARVMRQILIQHARSHGAAKRGNGSPLVSLNDTAEPGIAPAGTGLLDVDETLTRLESLDSRRAGIVEMRYFGGMTVPEIAHHLSLSVSTVEREMRLALAWLRRELSPATI